MSNGLRQLDKAIVAELLAPGLIDVTRRDIRTIVKKRRQVWVGKGAGTGPRKFQLATRAAFASAKVSKTKMKGVRGLLLHMVCDEKVTIMMMNEAITRIQKSIPCQANLIFGARFDSSINDRVQMSIVAAGIRD